MIEVFAHFRAFILLILLLVYCEIVCIELGYKDNFWCELDSLYDEPYIQIFRVTCYRNDTNTGLTSIGQQTDAIFETAMGSMKNYKMRMSISNISFVNNTITKEWYNGKCSIQYLFIYSPSLEFIAENAFNSTAFENLRGLHLSTSVILHWLGGILANTANLVHLLLYAKCIENMPLDSLQTARRFLSDLYLKSIPNHLSLNDLFGINSKKFGDLRTVYIAYQKPATEHILASHNFSALGAIEELFLTKCGITTIESGTFDEIAFTLRILTLTDNPIVTLPAMIFNRIIDSKKTTEIYIQVDRDLSQCNCEVLKTISSLILLELEEPNNYNNGICNDSSADQCPYVQTIYSRKFNKELLYAKRLVFAEFVLKIDVKREELTIRTTVDGRFHLWLHVDNEYVPNGKLNPCPSSDWIRTRVQCIGMTPALRKNVSVSRFAVETKITQICISYVSALPKTFLPLHCISVYWPEEIDEFDEAMMLTVLLTIIAFALVVGFFGYIIATQICCEKTETMKITYQSTGDSYQQNGRVSSQYLDSYEYSEISGAFSEVDSASIGCHYLDILDTTSSTSLK